jgi:LL-H family phage holin
MNDFVSSIATQLAMALVPVVVGALGYLVRWAISYVKARVASEHYKILSALAAQAVQAVEQTLKARPAQEKLQAAKAVVVGALAQKGITIDEELIAQAIESAVYNEKLQIRLIETPAAPTPVAAIPAVDVATSNNDLGVVA